jgi:hypothetical protein
MDTEVNSAFEEFSARLERGEALSREDGEQLLDTKDLIAVGVLADEVRHRRRGARVTFLRVLDVPPEGPIPPIASDTGELRLTGLVADSEEMLARIRQVASERLMVAISCSRDWFARSDGACMSWR